MSAPATNAALRAGGQRPSAGVWLAAAAELGVAVVVGLILFHEGRSAPPTTHSMPPGMADMAPQHHVVQIQWSAGFLALAVGTMAMLLWWASTRSRVPAGLASLGLVGIAASDPIRSLALQSHLVAMAALEAVLVATPLLLIATFRRRRDTLSDHRPQAWVTWVVISVAANSSFLVVLHLPGIHGRAASLDAVPLWLPFVAVLVGLCYWAAVLLTEGRVAPALRTGALIVGQEVAMILGLAALLLPPPHLHHASPLGLSSATDQRLGGLLMVLTCAVVAYPLTKRLGSQPHTRAPRMETHVH